MRLSNPRAKSALAIPIPERLPLIEAGGFSARVDAGAWEADFENRRLRIWFLSMLGSQQAVKAIWARLVKGEQATLTTIEPAEARFCGLAAQGPRGWRLHTASLPAAAGYQGVLVPTIAVSRDDQPEFVILARNLREVALLHYRFLDRRVDLPLHFGWADWLWERGMQTGEIRPLEGVGLAGFRCTPDRDALAVDLSNAIREHRFAIAGDVREAREELVAVS